MLGSVLAQVAQDRRYDLLVRPKYIGLCSRIKDISNVYSADIFKRDTYREQVGGVINLTGALESGTHILAGSYYDRYAKKLGYGNAELVGGKFKESWEPTHAEPVVKAGKVVGIHARAGNPNREIGRHYWETLVAHAVEKSCSVVWMGLPGDNQFTVVGKGEFIETAYDMEDPLSFSFESQMELLRDTCDMLFCVDSAFMHIGGMLGIPTHSVHLTTSAVDAAGCYPSVIPIHAPDNPSRRLSREPEFTEAYKVPIFRHKSDFESENVLPMGNHFIFLTGSNKFHKKPLVEALFERFNVVETDMDAVEASHKGVTINISDSGKLESYLKGKCVNVDNDFRISRSIGALFPKWFTASSLK